MISPTTDAQYGVDSNCNIRSEESVEVAMKSDKLAENLPNLLQFGHDAPVARKGSFVITDIRKDEDVDDSDSTLLADEPAAFEVAESPKRTQSLDNRLPWTTPPALSLTDSYSRFRIVKIESRDRWHIGRWTCHDFADPPERIKTEQTIESDGGANSFARNGPSIYYIPGVQDALKSPFGIVYNTGGHPVLEANFLPSSPRYARGLKFFSCTSETLDDVSGDVPPSQMLSQRTCMADQSDPAGHSAARKLFANSENNMLKPLKISVSAPPQNDSEHVENYTSLPSIHRQLSSSVLMAADAVQKMADPTSPLDAMMSATLGASPSEPEMSGSGMVAIDNKIEQAMELLKSHLMFAVHEEIEQLKEQITTLTDRNALLERENTALKQRASPETLALLHGNRQT